MSNIATMLRTQLESFIGNFMIAEREIFSPLRVAPPTETEMKAADAELFAAEEILTALCNSEGGIALCATLMGYGKVAPTTR